MCLSGTLVLCMFACKCCKLEGPGSVQIHVCYHIQIGQPRRELQLCLVGYSG